MNTAAIMIEGSSILPPSSVREVGVELNSDMGITSDVNQTVARCFQAGWLELLLYRLRRSCDKNDWPWAWLQNTPPVLYNRLGQLTVNYKLYIHSNYHNHDIYEYINDNHKKYQ